MVENIQRITGTTARTAARLCNFKTAEAELLEAHIEYLDREVASVIRTMQGPWVDLFGYASRTGDAAFNLALSHQRLNNVRQRISQYANQINFQIQTGLGETLSGPNEQDNSGYWRSVDVYVYAHQPPPPKSPLDPAATKFEIRVVGGGSFSVLLQSDNYLFQIVDLTRKFTGFYFYTGGGVGISMPKVPGPGSMTWAGPPTKFTTTRSTELHMFNSVASLEQLPGATVGPLSVGGTLLLTIPEIRDFQGFIETNPITIPVEGGSGIQMPGLGSKSKGVLTLLNIFPFSGY